MTTQPSIKPESKLIAYIIIGLIAVSVIAILFNDKNQFIESHREKPAPKQVAWLNEQNARLGSEALVLKCGDGWIELGILNPTKEEFQENGGNFNIVCRPCAPLNTSKVEVKKATEKKK